jgi:hypothetical protein
MDDDQEQRFRFQMQLEQEMAQQKPQGPDWRGVVGQGVREAFMGPGTVTRKMAVDPVAQARALPYLSGFTGGLSPIPGGATLGTAAGRGLSDIALKTYGRPELIPPVGQQLGEIGLAAIGDVAAIPYMKKAAYGPKIGAAEAKRGVETVAAERYPTSGNVGEVLNNLEAQLKSGTIDNPTVAKTAKDIVDFIWKNPNIVGKSNAIKVQAYRVAKLAEENLNRLVPGRAGPAMAMGKAMTIPRGIGKAYGAIPKPIKGLLGLAGAGAAGRTGWDLISRLIGR